MSLIVKDPGASPKVNRFNFDFPQPLLLAYLEQAPISDSLISSFRGILDRECPDPNRKWSRDNSSSFVFTAAGSVPKPLPSTETWK